VTLNIALT